jgi:hypothetical protein
MADTGWRRIIDEAFQGIAEFLSVFKQFLLAKLVVDGGVEVESSVPVSVRTTVVSVADARRTASVNQRIQSGTKLRSVFVLVLTSQDHVEDSLKIG